MNQHLLSVRNLSVTYKVSKSNAMPWSKPDILRAVSKFNFELLPKETLGIVGESGCGKSTLVRAIAGLVKPDEGEILFRGKKLDYREDPRGLRSQIQMIFQDSIAALNPRMTIADIVEEPLKSLHPAMSKSLRKRKVIEMLGQVGLAKNVLSRYPHEFSGGQCQRIGIARALICEPKLLICDEPISALDVSIQAQVINLLSDLKEDMDLSLIFVAHDLAVVRHISDRILVMYCGLHMEESTSETLFATPRHPYTQALLSAVPDPKSKLKRPALNDDLPSPVHLPQGCVFSTRCRQVHPRCCQDRPEIYATGGTRVACFQWDPDIAKA